MIYVMTGLSGDFQKYLELKDSLFLKKSDDLFILGGILGEKGGMDILLDAMTEENIFPIAGRQELAALKQQLEQPRFRPQTESELEAYRRAERAERAAHERVNQLYARANGALADATARTDETAMRLSDMAGQISAQLSALQTALTEGANTIRDAAATMYTIKPVSSDE